MSPAVFPYTATVIADPGITRNRVAQSTAAHTSLEEARVAMKRISFSGSALAGLRVDSFVSARRDLPVPEYFSMPRVHVLIKSGVTVW